MTHQNHQTNGASLEDCHTNFFALTELYGIKWRKLVWGESGGAGGSEEGAPLEDPVISSYARCLAGDILCVWRRVPQPAPPADLYEMPAPAPPPPLSLRAAKELWIFWYGEEPDLNGLVAPELIASQGEHGSWESGLSYECRSLLFKALHNLIERCLLSRDFVRLGKWFVQPYDGDEEDVGKSPWHLSFSFAFFLHGESTVCASVDVRQHPPVRTLTARRLRAVRAAAAALDNHQVILAPFGLAARLSGRQWADSDADTARLLDHWRALYPLHAAEPAVEVICGGVRMRYPRAYVLLADPDEGAAGTTGGPGAAGGGGGTLAPSAAHLAPRTLRALAAPAPHQPPEVCYADCADRSVDFAENTRRALCCCNKWRRRRAARAPPFHRRALRRRTEACVGAASPGSGGGGSPAAAGSAPPSAGPPPASPHHTTTTTHAPLHNMQSAVQVPTTLHTPAPTPDPLAPPTPAPPSAPPTKLFQGDSPGGCTSTPPGSNGLPSLLRRPVLPAEEARAPDRDHRHLSMLYDYSTVHAWLEHPVKRFRPSEPVFKEELSLCSSNGDLYAGQEHTCVVAAAPEPASLKRERNDNEDVKDYKNLFTSDGLCPTLKDLDQIFDNSDDASGDETMAVRTPPESKCTLEERCGGGRCVRAEELSKMFPTPPSMEAHAQPSPGLSLPEEPASPPPDPIDDWSYVFRAPPLARYVGSSKYAPLPHLPSQLLPRLPLPHDAVYRPRWQRPGGSPGGATPAPRAPSPPPAPVPAPPPRAAPRDKAGRDDSRTNTSVTSCAAPPTPPARPACPLLVNVLLGDTLLNLFRDHNFDSCTLCVCNAGTRVVGNIRGADAAYLPGADAAPQDDDAPACSCGFSAVVNRRLAHRAGLFYEDELEITGAADEPGGAAGAGGGALREVAAVAAHAASARAGRACLLTRAAASAAAATVPADQRALNTLAYSDGGAAAAKALRAAGGPEPGEGTGGKAGAADGLVHRWPYLVARPPRSSRDVLRLMRRLRPLLQDATQKRSCGERLWDGVKGPLTWRQFHRLAGRLNEDLCEPQPVPQLLLGHERDWLTLSPYALRHWERLALEPYGYPRDVAYAVLAPAAPALTDPLRAFFRELGAAYEAARLGRHRPLARLARDALLRVPPAPAPAPAPAASDEWAGELPPGRLGDYIRAYAEALRALVTQLNALTVDAAVLEAEAAGEAGAADAEEAPAAEAEEEGGTPALVVYLVEPPAAAAAPARSLLALLRLADHAARALHKHNPLFKFISVDGIQEWWSGTSLDAARSLAFGVYAGVRRGGAAGAAARSLTGFGPAAAAAMAKQPPWNLRAPAVVLAPVRRDGEWGSTVDVGAVLFVAYCLSHDQRWLLAGATDARGELRDTVAINIHVPPRSRRRRSSHARRLGLTKLMDFILGVMSQLAQPWRLVVGRLGRIGHGELKGWSWLLSRKNLVRASGVLREMCGACAAAGGAVAVTSACLVSTEPERALRLMADRFTPDERFATQSALSTPRDVSASHILVFPTSATTQSSTPFEAPLAADDPDMMFLGVDMDMADEEMGEDNMTDLIISDMFTMFQSSPRASPRRDASPGEPGSAEAEARRAGPEPGEHVGALLQQPLALGYLVSTAPLPAMPRGWGAADACPAFLKSALHVHAACVHAADDLATLTRAKDQLAHPLDSGLTTDVLRYVLERYNALSWLGGDARGDRACCLPLHMQLLLQLYHAQAALP